ncbi:hypothetical protein Psi02_32870 [Planotetraspora silvatica]|uniref:Ricin B lectin domain-containing protein n=1 Tax=Planotetraspora silvatica TaxID=234614 RepID=A0A8J3XS39_9ACTN|nr:hypothetical protein [Planotetraspora silvatica]GII46863.1 hypothetical protein Psi02_32870 [Planotetraspora silvatica]
MWSSGVIRAVDCDGGTAQQWYWLNSAWNVDELGEPYRRLKNRWTGKCLVAVAEDEDVKSGPCDDWTSRHWRLLSGITLSQFSSDIADGWLMNNVGTDHVHLGYGTGYTECWYKIRMN